MDKHFNRQANQWYKDLSLRQKQFAFYTVTQKLYHAELVERRSYRGTLYGMFEFGPDMYTRGIDSGFMALHNSIVADSDLDEKYESLLDSYDNLIKEYKIMKQFYNELKEELDKCNM